MPRKARITKKGYIEKERLDLILQDTVISLFCQEADGYGVAKVKFDKETDKSFK